MSDPDSPTILITGGTRGVGKGIAQTFLQSGATVIVCGREKPNKLPCWPDDSRIATKSDLNEAIFISADIRDPDECKRLIKEVIKATGRLDVLINNAGGSPPADAATASPRFSEAIIRLNLIAPLNLAQQAYQAMAKQDGECSIINIASVSGIRPSPGTSAYGAAKAGLISLTQSLAVEWAPKVRVNCIIAGPIKTEQSALHYGDEAGISRVAKTIPQGRLGEPQDIGSACLFLASSAAQWINGTKLEIHGGGERPAFLNAANGNQKQIRS